MSPVCRYSQYGYGNTPYPTQGQTFDYQPDQPGEGFAAQPADDGSGASLPYSPASQHDCCSPKCPALRLHACIPCMRQDHPMPRAVLWVQGDDEAAALCRILARSGPYCCACKGRHAA